MHFCKDRNRKCKVATKPGPFARRKGPNTAGKLTQRGFGVCLHKWAELAHHTCGWAWLCSALWSLLAVIFRHLWSSHSVWQSPLSGGCCSSSSWIKQKIQRHRAAPHITGVSWNCCEVPAPTVPTWSAMDMWFHDFCMLYKRRPLRCQKLFPLRSFYSETVKKKSQ